MYEYQVVPFFAATPPGSTEAQRRQAAASQYQTLLQQMHSQGFEYLRMDHYHLTEQPGCVGALLGMKVTIVTYNAAVFRRRVG